MRNRRTSSERVRLIAATVTILLACGACGTAQTTDRQTSTTVASTSSTTLGSTSSTSMTTSTTGGPVPDVTVSELLDLQFKQEVRVSGMVITTRGITLLCEALAESFPPQCGGRWMVITNPAGIGAEFTTEGAVSWSEKPLALLGHLEADRFVLSDAPSGVEVTDADRALVAAFVSFARGDSEASDLPVSAQGLELGLADRFILSRSVHELSDPAAWEIDFEPFRGRVSPFSARDLLADPGETVITIGPHNHCAAVPTPAPADTAHLRQVSVQPLRASSCLDWYTVDFFVDDDGRVVGITLDLWEP